MPISAFFRILRFAILPLGSVVLAVVSSQSAAFAGGGTMTNGGNYGGSILRGQIDQWTFTAAQENAVEVSVSEVGRNTGFVPQVEVFAPNGTRLGFAYDVLFAKVAFVAPEDGTYIARVQRYGGGSTQNGGAGEYSLTLAESGQEFIVPPGDDGGPISNGATVSGSLLRGDIDQWSFVASEGQSVEASASKVGADPAFVPQVEVFAPNGTRLGFGYDALFAKVTFVAPKDGTYIVRVQRYGGGSKGANDGIGQYSLTLALSGGAAVSVPAAAPAPRPTAAPQPTAETAQPAADASSSGMVPQAEPAPAAPEPAPAAPEPTPMPAPEFADAPAVLDDTIQAEILAAVNRANVGWAQAKQTLDTSDLASVVAGQELSNDLGEVARLRSQGQMQISANTSFEVLDVALDGPGRGLVQTRETWSAEIHALNGGQLLQRLPPVTYLETYTVEWQGGGWIVTLDEVR